MGTLWVTAGPAQAADGPSSPTGGTAENQPAASGPQKGQEGAAKARELYEQGLAAMGQQRWAEAETLFEQAYALKRHFQIAGNLGTCELELGKHAEAADHLHTALAELGDDPNRQRERLALKKLLTTARAQSGTLELRIEPSGLADLDVRVDGHLLPWPQRLVFVEPGHHQIVASESASGRRGELEVDVEAGLTRKLTLQLTGGSAAADPSGDLDPDGDGLPSYPIWIGAAATVAAAGAGIVAQVVGSGAETDADQLRNEIVAGQASCSTGCPELLDRYAEADRGFDASTGLFIAAGALAAATVGYTVLVMTDTADEPVATANLGAGPGGLAIGLTFSLQ
jgi:tetratricopeptide (TPR) repeat protein